MQCKKLGKQPIASQSYIEEWKEQKRKNKRDKTKGKDNRDRTIEIEQG
jgi:hypothetical protein